jgi:putative transposase
MPAFARVAFAGIPYHVTQRGNYRQDVFFSDEDRATYLGFVVRAAENYHLDLHGWCLMSNHVHWVVIPHAPHAMAQSFRRAHSQYARYINSQNKRRSGHLWQARYYSCPLDEPHFDAALLYVERNPVRAGLANAATDYRWSSAAARVGLRTLPRFLKLHEWNKRYSPDNWQHRLTGAQDADMEQSLRASTLQGKPFGSPDFIEQFARATGRPMNVRPIGRPNTQKVDGGSFYPRPLA